jgi:hypothetical protein
VLRTAFEERGLDNACEIYESLLDDHDHRQALVKIIDWREPWRTHDFHVIDICIRLLSDFRTARVHEIAEKVGDMNVDWMLEQVAGNAKFVETKELRYWTMVANPIQEKISGTNFKNMNEVLFWENQHVQTMTTYVDECEKVRDAVQRIVMYADLDPDRGINPAINMVNTELRGKDWEHGMLGDMVQQLHRLDRPMRDEPWKKEGTTWVDGRIEANNYTALIQLCKRVPRIETFRDGARATPLGEQEDIAEISPFEGKQDIAEIAPFEAKPDVKDTDYTTYALIAGAAVAVYVVTR